MLNAQYCELCEKYIHIQKMFIECNLNENSVGERVNAFDKIKDAMRTRDGLRKMEKPMNETRRVALNCCNWFIVFMKCKIFFC